jgi:hypothetical protein
MGRSNYPATECCVAVAATGHVVIQRSGVSGRKNQVCGVGGVWSRPGRAILAGYDDARRHLALRILQTIVTLAFETTAVCTTPGNDAVCLVVTYCPWALVWTCLLHHEDIRRRRDVPQLTSLHHFNSTTLHNFIDSNTLHIPIPLYPIPQQETHQPQSWPESSTKSRT